MRHRLGRPVIGDCRVHQQQIGIGNGGMNGVVHLLSSLDRDQFYRGDRRACDRP